MELKQLSLFMENKPGQLLNPCKALGDAGINIIMLALADTQQFGILRIIVHDWEKAKGVLEKAGCVVSLTDVVGVKIPSKPGGLAGILRIAEEAGMNVEYMYAIPGSRDRDGILIFRFEDNEGAIQALKVKGLRLVSNADLEKLLEG